MKHPSKPAKLAKRPDLLPSGLDNPAKRDWERRQRRATKRAAPAKSPKPFVTPAHGWHDKDQLDALTEGWGVFDIDNTGKLAIQRADESALDLGSDAAALALVLGMAQQGFRLHRKAIAHVLGFVPQSSHAGLVGALAELVTEADQTGGRERTVSRYAVDKGRAALKAANAGQPVGADYSGLVAAAKELEEACFGTDRSGLREAGLKIRAELAKLGRT